MSNTPLYCIGESEENLTEGAQNPQDDIQRFSTGAGEAYGSLASGVSSFAINNNANPMNTSPKIDVTNVHGGQSQNNINKAPNNIVPTMNAEMSTMFKDFIISTQQDMMADIIASLTTTFRETLQVEATKIDRAQVQQSANLNQSPGDESQFRLSYRVPRAAQNEAPPNQNQNAFQRQNPNQPFINYQVPLPNIPNPPNCQNINRIPLDKWGFKFNGSNMSVEDFLFRVECKQINSNYTWHEVYNNLNNILADPVENWYWNFRKHNPRAEYESFKLALSERYPSKDNDVDLWRKLINRKQKAAESFDDFVDDVERIYYRMIERPSVIQLVNVIRDNVTPEISTYIGLSRTNSLAGIKLLARDAEKLVDKLNPNKYKFPRKNINEVATDSYCRDEEDHAFIEAFTPYNRDYKVYQCTKFSQKFRVNEKTKEEKRIYCYDCGKEGVTRNSCTVCQENRKASE